MEQNLSLEEIKLIFKNIVELVEDKDYPAKRVITDYALQLVPNEYRKYVEEYVISLYFESERRSQR